MYTINIACVQQLFYSAHYPVPVFLSIFISSLFKYILCFVFILKFSMLLFHSLDVWLSFFNLVRLSFLWFQFNSVRLGSVPLPISVEGEYAFVHKHRFRGYIIKSIEVWVSGMDFEQPFPSEHSFHTNSQKIHIQISRHRLCLSFIPFEWP